MKIVMKVSPPITSDVSLLLLCEKFEGSNNLKVALWNFLRINNQNALSLSLSSEKCVEQKYCKKKKKGSFLKVFFFFKRPVYFHLSYTLLFSILRLQASMRSIIASPETGADDQSVSLNFQTNMNYLFLHTQTVTAVLELYQTPVWTH